MARSESAALSDVASRTEAFSVGVLVMSERMPVGLSTF